MYIDKNDFKYWTNIDLDKVSEVTAVLKQHGIPFIIESKATNADGLPEPQLVAVKVLAEVSNRSISNLVNRQLP